MSAIYWTTCQNLIISKSDQCWLRQFSEQVRKSRRIWEGLWIIFILLDMSLHFIQLQAIQTNLNNRTKVMSFVLHSADVAHPTKAWDLHKEWTARCMEEFFNQGDREKEMGLDVSPLCDRNTTQAPQSQIGKSEMFLKCLLEILNVHLNKHRLAFWQAWDRCLKIEYHYRVHQFYCLSTIWSAQWCFQQDSW